MSVLGAKCKDRPASRAARCPAAAARAAPRCGAAAAAAATRAGRTGRSPPRPGTGCCTRTARTAAGSKAARAAGAAWTRTRWAPAATHCAVSWIGCAADGRGASAGCVIERGWSMEAVVCCLWVNWETFVLYLWNTRIAVPYINDAPCPS